MATAHQIKEAIHYLETRPKYVETPKWRIDTALVCLQDYLDMLSVSETKGE